MESACSMLLAKGKLKYFCSEAVNTAVYLLNRTPSTQAARCEFITLRTSDWKAAHSRPMLLNQSINRKFHELKSHHTTRITMHMTNKYEKKIRINKIPEINKITNSINRTTLYAWKINLNLNHATKLICLKFYHQKRLKKEFVAGRLYIGHYS